MCGYRMGWMAIIGAICWHISGSLGMAQTLKSFVLSNGSQVELRSIKEGNYEWFESHDGFAVVRTPDRYEYAFPTEDGGIVASGVLADGTAKKLPFPSGLRPTPEFLRKRRAETVSPGPPPSPHPISVTQPDGHKLELYLKGSASYSWYEDKGGYTVLPVKGRMEYALRSPEGALVGSGIEVNSMQAGEAGLKPGIRPGAEFLRKQNSSQAP